MNDSTRFQRDDFDKLLADHQELIRRANELEYQLYRLGEGGTAERVQECQKAGGVLIGLLRSFLFRHDQQILPVLDVLTRCSAD